MKRDVWFLPILLAGVLGLPILAAALQDSIGTGPGMALAALALVHAFVLPRIWKDTPSDSSPKPFVFALDPDWRHLPKAVEIGFSRRKFVAESAEGAVTFLSEHSEGGDTHCFELTHQQAPDYCLDLRLSGDLACLHYFTAECDEPPLFRTKGDAPVGAPEILSFDDIEALPEEMVSKEDALRAVREFFEEPKPPASLTWVSPMD